MGSWDEKGWFLVVGYFLWLFNYIIFWLVVLFFCF